ncbi:MAG: hypothetical protein HQK76_03790 [Desulfobacterales bacterium]|nr:hypothetical protein [Desulfobacterales bacterium]
MNKKFTLKIFKLTIFSLIFLGIVSLAQSSEFPLIQYDTQVIYNEALPINVFPSAHRLRMINLDPIISSPSRLSKGDSLVLNLFPDKTYTAEIDRIIVNKAGTISLRGRIQGYSLGYVLISTTEDRSLASICVPEKGERYQIQSDQITKTHFLLELNVAELDQIEDGPALIPPESYSRSSDNSDLTEDKTLKGASDNIDVMIAYTPAAKQWADTSGGGMANVIAQAMEKAQMTLDNSNTLLSMSLVHSVEINYTESGSSNTDLYRLTFHSGYDPWGYEGEPRYMDDIHQLRTNYGADLVSLFALVSDTGGLGWLLNTTSGWPELGFCLVRVQQAGWTYTLVHELGHNMGLGHHKEQTVQPGPGLFSYSAGWRWVGNDSGKYCSVMTYENGQYFSDGQTHTRVAYFSNPSIYHQGMATGNAQDADNARNLREIKSTVAAYKQITVSSLSVTPTTKAVENTSGTFSVTVTSNVAWTVFESSSWLSVSSTSGSNNSSFTVTYDANTGTERSAVITVSGGGKTATVTVTQKSVNTEKSSALPGVFLLLLDK